MSNDVSYHKSPSFGIEKKGPVLAIKMTESEYQAVTALAEKYKLSRSAYFYNLVIRHLCQVGQLPPGYCDNLDVIVELTD
jgi:hypothetical protein